MDQTSALAPSPAKKHCQGSPKAARGAAKAPKIGQGIPKPGGGFEQISSWKSTETGYPTSSLSRSAWALGKFCEKGPTKYLSLGRFQGQFTESPGVYRWFHICISYKSSPCLNALKPRTIWNTFYCTQRNPSKNNCCHSAYAPLPRSGEQCEGLPHVPLPILEEDEDIRVSGQLARTRKGPAGWSSDRRSCESARGCIECLAFARRSTAHLAT